jgi:membrane associated rhomboid family serine protease
MFLSFLTGFGILPVGSDALGHHRPRATWLIAAVTCLVSIWFWTLNDQEMMHKKDLMLWTGSALQDADHLRMMYEYTDYGNWSEFTHQVQEKYPEGRHMRSLDAIPDSVIIEAHLALAPHERATAGYKGMQLLTHGLLHADIFHLLGNMLFLLIFGSRVNALIGNLATLALYPMLIVIAGVIHMVASSSGPPIPMLGASGAIMGMAGMYFMLFPLSKVYMAAYMRIFIVIFRMSIWSVYGLVVVGLYILIDVFWVSVAMETGTAHWAHIGGFLGGVVLAAILLLSRLLNASGADLLSVTLGKHAWAILGTPGEHGLPGLQIPRFATEEAPTGQRVR